MWWCYCFFNRQGGFEERATAKSATSEMPFFVNMLHGAYQQEKGCLGKKDWLTFNKSIIQILAYSILDEKSLSVCYLSERCKLLSHAEKQLGALPRLPGASIGWAGVDPPRRVGGSDTKPKPRTSFQAYSCLPSLHQPSQQVLPTILLETPCSLVSHNFYPRRTLTTSLRGSHGLSARRPQRTKPSRPEGAPTRSWGPVCPYNSS